MNHAPASLDPTPSINPNPVIPFGNRVSLLRCWLARVVLEENVFLFLIGARWFSLLPALFTILWRPESELWQWAFWGAAVAVNLALSLWHTPLDRLVMRRPALIGVDMAFCAILLAFNGGAASVFFFYALTPVLASAFFSSSLRGGLLAALWFTPFYALAAVWAQDGELSYSYVDLAFTRLCVLYGAAFIFGYQSLLLRRLRDSSSELRRTQEELGRAETLAALGKLVAHVSHEIRNPLVTLGGYAHALARRPQDANKVQHHAEIMVSEISRLEELLNDLLDLSRPRDVPKGSGNLHDILDRACLLTCDDWERHQIALRKDYEPALPPLPMNAPALLRALLNVTRNALQAMPEGGVLTLSTRLAHNEILVTITDTGKGIPSDKLPTIWQPFVTHREGGTGLGLAVTQQIVAEHGGWIEVQSEVGKGTSFTFHFPLGNSSQSSAN